MEVKFHFGVQWDKNDLQKVDDRLLFYALGNSEDQIEPSRCPPHFFDFSPLSSWMVDTNFA